MAILQKFDLNEDFKQTLSRILDYEEFLSGSCSNLMLNAISFCRYKFSIGNATEVLMNSTFPDLLVTLEHPETYHDSLQALNNFVSNVSLLYSRLTLIATPNSSISYA